MRLDEEDLHQQIKSQDNSAPALFNDSGGKKWLIPTMKTMRNFTNFLKPVGFSFEVLPNYYLHFFIFSYRDSN